MANGTCASWVLAAPTMVVADRLHQRCTTLLLIEQYMAGPGWKLYQYSSHEASARLTLKQGARGISTKSKSKGTVNMILSKNTQR